MLPSSTCGVHCNPQRCMNSGLFIHFIIACIIWTELSLHVLQSTALEFMIASSQILRFFLQIQKYKLRSLLDNYDASDVKVKVTSTKNGLKFTIRRFENGSCYPSRINLSPVYSYICSSALLLSCYWAVVSKLCDNETYSSILVCPINNTAYSTAMAPIKANRGCNQNRRVMYTLHDVESVITTTSLLCAFRLRTTEGKN